MYFKLALALAAGILSAQYLGTAGLFVYVFSFILANLTISTIFKSHKKYLCLIALCYLFGVIYAGVLQAYETRQLYPFCERYVTVSGYVSEIPIENNGRYSYIIRCDTVTDNEITLSIDECVRLNTDKKLSYAQRLEVSGFIRQINDKMNYSDFDYARYYKSRGVFYRISDFSVSEGAQMSGLKGFSHFKKLYTQRLLNRCEEIATDDCAALLKSVVAGYKKDFSDEYHKLLIKTGSIRFLYPSYLHIMIILLFVNVILNFFDRRKKDNAIIIAITLYALINCDKAAHLKCALVIIISIIVLKKKGYTHFPDILSLSVIAILVYNPLMLYDTGFVISVGTSWGIFMIKDIIIDFYSFIPFHKLRTYLSTLSASSLGSLPFVAYLFNRVSITSILFSPIYLLLVCEILILFYIHILLTAISPVLSFMLYPLTGALNCLYKLAYLIESLPLSKTNLACFDLLVVIVVLIAFALAKRLYYKKTDQLSTLMLGTAFCGGIAAIVISFISSIGSFGITFVNVGQGDGAILSLPNDETIIVDGGGAEEFQDFDAGEKIFLPYLENEGISRIDLAIVSHFHKDHCLGTIAAMKNLNVGTVAMPYIAFENEYKTTIESLAKQKGIRILYLDEGDVIKFESGAVIRVISAGCNSSTDENDTSIVFEITCNGFSALFTSDITNAVELENINNFNDIDLLKVAHHGSKNSTSEEFLEITKPEYAVISAGEDNSYDHPSYEVLKRLKNADAKILRTDLLGDIRIKVDRHGNMSYSSYYPEKD